MDDSVSEIKTAANDLLRVNAQGAKIEVLLGGISVLGKFQRGDGKDGITHPCTPIFGPDRKNMYWLKQHGNMRNEVCEVKQEGNKIVVTHMITDPGYPAGMNVEQMMQVEGGVFRFEMTHTNTGTEAAAVNAGEHCYFDAPRGFEETIVNGQDITDLIKNNVDGIAIDLEETNTIVIPGKPKYILEQQGFNKAVVWVGKNTDTKAIDRIYICIEPVEEDPFGDFFGSRESMIVPEQNKKVGFSLRIK